MLLVLVNTLDSESYGTLAAKAPSLQAWYKGKEF